jgi:hypothetical protein
MPSTKLIGTAPDQVPVNSSLGGMAFQSPDNVSFNNGRGGLSSLELTSVFSQLAHSGTIKKIFVYDTSRDSDGGAWRRRTSATSWYNEPLNTATRGSRKEFPAVAVIVTNADNVTIYDGDDPQLPMWMVFQNVGVLSWATSASPPIMAVSAVNGYLAVATETAGGMIFSFAGDDTKVCYSAPYALSNQLRLIANRNTATTNTVWNSVGSYIDGYVLNTSAGGYTLRNCTCTVLPNAPIDPKSGLPRPTFAFACGVSGIDGGVSIVRDDETVVIGGKANDSWNCEFVVFDKDNVLWSAEGLDSGYGGLQVISIPPYDVVRGIGVGSLGYAQAIAPFTNYGTEATWPKVLGGGIRAISRDTNNVAIAHTASSWTTGGITKIHEEPQDRKATMMAYIGTDYNTGWMPGPAAIACLNSNKSGVLDGSYNYVANSSCSTTTGYSNYNSTIASNGSVITATATSTALYGAVYVVDNLVIGQAYHIQADFTTSNSTPNVRIQMGGLGLRYSSGALTAAGSATVRDTFVATSTTMNVEFLEYGTHATGATFTIDNVMLKAAENDRSENMFGLEVGGQIYKSSAVNGSDVQAYSNFNNGTNYLKNWYFRDLNQSSWTMMCWYNGNHGAGEQIPISFGTISSTGQTRAMYISGGYFGFAGWSMDYISTKFVDDSTWHLLAISAIHLGSNVYNLALYVDGELVGNTTLPLSTYTVRTLDIGGGNLPGSRFVRGSISMARVTAHATGLDAMRKIYADERELFTPEAKSTIYGSSNQVGMHALAYDDDTDTLHAATSSGRSSFVGLRRVDFDTNVAINAIHAANGLIVEA